MANNRLKYFDDNEFYDNDCVKELGKTVLPDPQLLDYFNMLSNREIFINDDIDDELAYFSKQIIDWNKKDKNFPIEDRIPIKIFINTDGGSASAVMNFIDVIQMSKTPVYTIGMGRCYSAGCLLLAGGHKGKRFVFKNTTIMLHKGSSGIISDVNKIIDYSNFLVKTKEIDRQYILSNTKVTPKKYKEIEDKDWYLISDEIIEWGFADKIIESIDEII